MRSSSCTSISSTGDVTRPLRVFHLIKSLGRGGAEVLLAEGLRVADRDRFTYGYGYFLPWKDAVVPSLEEQGAEVVCFSARSNLAILLSAVRVAAFLRRWKADLLHCHLPVAAAAGRVAGKLAGVPVVTTEHNEVEHFHPLTRRLDMATWRWQRQAIAISEPVADSLARHASPKVPVRVVLNGVDVDHFNSEGFSGADVRREWGIPEEAPVVGTVAVFTDQKRIDWWLETARRIQDRHAQARFLIVGDGPRKDYLLSEAERLGLGGTAHFVGLQEDVRPYLAAMDVYMMSSEYEGFGVALIEAMAFRRPVAALGVGGIPGIVRDGESGVLVAPRDVGALAEAASDLLDDPERRRRMGERGRQTVKDRFSMRRMARELEAIYLDVVHRKGRD